MLVNGHVGVDGVLDVGVLDGVAVVDGVWTKGAERRHT